MGTRQHYRLAVSAFFFIQGLVYSSWASRIPDIKGGLGLDEGQFGAVLLALPAGQLAAMMLSGYLVNRFGSRVVLGLAAILYPLALINLSLAANLWQFVLFGFLFGTCGNLSNISVNTQGVGVERLYGTSIMGGFHGVWSIASFFGGVLGMGMVALGFTPTIHFSLVLGIASGLLLVFYRSTLPRDRKPAPVPSADGGRKPNVFRNRYILILGAIGCSSMMCEGAMFNWSGIYFKEVIRPDPRWINVGYIAFTFAMTCGRFMAGRVVTRYGVVRVMQAGGLTILVGLLIAALFPGVVTSAIGLALVGIGTSAIVPLCYSMAGRAVSIPTGSAIAGVSSISFLGFLIGPPLIGGIAQISNLRYSFALVALFGLVIALLASRVRGK